MTKTLTSSAALVCATLGLSSVGAFADDQAAAPAAPAPPTLAPNMGGPLTANASPTSYDLSAMPGLGRLLGKTYVTGWASGFGQWQNHTVPSANPGSQNGVADVSNGQIFIQRVDSFFQYFVQVGVYSIPELGQPYVKASTATDLLFGPLPQASIKIAPTDSLSISAGKLPTLIGAEDTFTLENMNIERGLLWNQENAVTHGVQVDYSQGPLDFSLSFNDGFYSGRWNWLSGSATWTIDKENTLAIVGGGALSRESVNTFATPVFQNNEQIYNIIYTYSSGPLTVSPYVQYTHVPALTGEINGTGTATTAASTYGGALLVAYAVDSNFSVAARGEYLASTGNKATGPNLMYGVASKAWSLTLTPTYQFNVFFVRAEGSYVKATNTTPGLAFGPLGNDSSQVRGLVEFGVIF